MDGILSYFRFWSLFALACNTCHSTVLSPFSDAKAAQAALVRCKEITDSPVLRTCISSAHAWVHRRYLRPRMRHSQQYWSLILFVPLLFSLNTYCNASLQPWHVLKDYIIVILSNLYMYASCYHISCIDEKCSPTLKPWRNPKAPHKGPGGT